MLDEGYIKFSLDWERGPALAESQIRDLNAVRCQLFDLGLIGEYPEEGIGYGNVSQKVSANGLFVVSGTQTGHIRETGAQHYAEVLASNPAQNYLKCRGPIIASSESMTHAAFYELSPRIESVLHVHHEKMWESLLFKLPTTAEPVPYGTPEMAKEIRRLWDEEDLEGHKFALMAGHREGIFSFGESLQEALAVLLEHFEEFRETGVAVK